MLSYKEIARELRCRLLRMHYEARSSHLGTALSEVDLLVYLFASVLRPQDRFVLSKGHGASGLYATLNYFQQIPLGLIDTYYKDNTKLAAHPSPLAVEAIPVATGSLGHGLSVAVGMALAAKLKGALNEEAKRVVCLVSDGECNEGTIWEAALVAGHHELGNLTVVVDNNGIQGFGYSKDILDMTPFADKWRAFGFDVQVIDGHDFVAMERAFEAVQSGQKPACLIANTVKGKGVSFMENTIDWHYLNLTSELYEKALAEVMSGVGK